MLDRSEHVALVTGATRGIGASIARRLVRDGWRVSLGGRSLDALAQVLPPGEQVHHALYEARDPSAGEELAAATAERWGRIDALVNNAGVMLPFTVEDEDETNLDATLDVNVKAPLRLSRACLPYLRRSGTGRIINVASLSGKRVKNDNVAYAMSKFAMVALTHGLRRVGWEDGVRATALCPGFVRTDLTASATKVARDDMTDPDDLAEIVAVLLKLPNTASVAEFMVNCRAEDMF